MSYPPRPPMGMPPGMMPPGYGYAPMGMMPMPMGMMPPGPMMRTSMPMTTSASIVSNSFPKQSKKLIPQEIPKSDKKDDKPPITTVFVGNISERAPDAMVRQMLMRCGNVLSWKRVQGASGKLQAFGFCEYEDPEATLRCIRLLNEWNIVDKKLVVKVDAKTKTLLDDYKTKKKEKEGMKEESEKEDIDDFTQREDRVAKAGLDAIMREYSRELSKEPEHSYKAQKAEQQKKEKREREQKKEKEKEPAIRDTGLDNMELEEDQKSLINREIKIFRDAHKDEDDKDKDKDKEREREKRRREEELREREWERERRDREKELKRREHRERTRSRTPERSRSRERDRERRDRDKEDEEEVYERRKLERKLREKEGAYQERLKIWEARERKKAREYEKEREKEEERRAEEMKEARRLREFLEDYDDERDDPKFYKGSALQRRLKEREKEMEADHRDRQREKEELEEIRRKLMQEGHPDPEAEMAKIERERDEHLMPRLRLDPEPEPESIPEPRERERERDRERAEREKEREWERERQQREREHERERERQHERELEREREQKLSKMQPTLKPVEPAAPVLSVSSQSSPDSDNAGSMSPSEDSSSQQFIGPASKEDQTRAKIGFNSLKLGSSDSPTDSLAAKRKKLTVGDVFNQDETAEVIKKRKLVPLDYSEEEKAVVVTSKVPTTAEEKRKHIKNLIEQIPTGKEELFAYPLDWSMVDQNLMDKRIKPWVNKKIVDYIGEEEATLTEFICQKVIAHSTPQIILSDVAMVLDEEAEVFVVKMWRLLIYETEAKKAGLVK